MTSDFHDRLDAGEVLLGCCIMYPSPGVIERIGPDWDWFWIDAQHGEMGYNDVLALVRACDLAGKASIVRVPSHEASWISKALDAGATGVMVPQVSDAEEARAVVKAAKFPPLGARSYGARRVIDLRGRGYSDTANEETILMAQVETPQAVKMADDIAAVPGIDALLVGPDDISLCLGLSMTEPKPTDKVREWQQAVIDACRKHGGIPVAVGGRGRMLELLVSLGFRMIVCGGDVSFLAEGSKEAAENARAIIAGRKEVGGKGDGVSDSHY